MLVIILTAIDNRLDENELFKETRTHAVAYAERVLVSRIYVSHIC